ncbi:uncharacterized protein LOC123319025 [Coccinella septempunctata]|uniref:uncharacterized protein LOC123319025 n=1 Tax=Coccinella septempunctata TaxID=41139 RepID=UPI001D078080|nr:uncharacterized protein LOC123319025 [Coccinella septempunctata]
MVAMWIFLAFIWSIVFVSSKPARSLDRHRWVENTAREEMLGPYYENKPEKYGIFLPEGMQKSMSNVDLDDIIFQQPSQKRALTMFGRWGPINELGKERSSIRSTDRLHSSTGRKMGQPFRWG